MFLRALLASLAVSATAAAAQELTVYGGAELEFLIEPDGSGSDNRQDLAGYVEMERGPLYAGIWAQLSSQSSYQEVDVYLGYRSATEGGLDYDIGYTRYIYPKDGGDCCGDLTLSLGYPAGDYFYPSADLYFDPETSVGSAYVGLEYYPAEKWTLSANYGVYETDGAPNEQEWDFGVAYALGEETAFDVRYYDGSDYESYLGLTLSWDTTILSR
jgi:hypothetical protein